jgi:hypothetical protein
MTNEQDLLLAEIIVKITAIERLLTKSGIFTSDQLVNEMKAISSEVLSFISNNKEKIFKVKGN